MLNTMAPTFAVWQPTKTVEKKIKKKNHSHALSYAEFQAVALCPVG